MKIHRKMVRHIMVYPYEGILFSNLKNKQTIYTHNTNKSQNIVMRNISQTYYMIPFT